MHVLDLILHFQGIIFQKQYKTTQIQGVDFVSLELLFLPSVLAIDFCMKIS
jgi:hypothetical protein